MVIIGLFSPKKEFQLMQLKGRFLLGFAGICVIFYEHLQDFLNPEFFIRNIYFVNRLHGLWAIGTMFTKKKPVILILISVLGLQMFLSGLVLLDFSYGTGRVVPLTMKLPWQSWTAIGYLVVAGSILAFVAYLYSLQHLSVEQMSIYAYINPVVAVISRPIIIQ